MDPKVLIIEDDSQLRQLVTYLLKKEGYHVIDYESAEEALNILDSFKPDLILLDIMLPGMDGYEFSRTLHQQYHSNLPYIIILTQKSSIEDVTEGLNYYGDDYIAKPFNNKILLARIKAGLRRNGFSAAQKKTITIGDISIDTDQSQVFIKNTHILLSRTLYDILLLLISHPGQIFSKQEILEHINKDGKIFRLKTVDQYFYRLRSKLEPSDVNLTCVKGFGFKIENPE